MSADYLPSPVDAALERFAAGQEITSSARLLCELLGSPKLMPEPVMRLSGESLVLDLSRGSMMLGEPLSGLSVERFTQLVRRACAHAGASFAYGRWGERREIYSNDLFATQASTAMRDVHMGIDVFCEPGEAVHAPMAGKVHIKANNAQELDYGPLLILEHEVAGGHRFFTLYGHLGLQSLLQIEVGQSIAAGDTIAEVGAPPENGNWAPHLHFQLILDLLDLGADFPGVAYPAQQEAWLALSPKPARFFPDCDPASLDGRERKLCGT